MTRYLALAALLCLSQSTWAQETFIDLPKAIVKFDGTPKTGTMVKTGPTIVVSKGSTPYTVHAGDGVYLDFPSGATTRGYFIVDSVNNAANTFTVTHTNAFSNSSGSAVVRTHVTVAMNIASVIPKYETYNCQYGLCSYRFVDGQYIITFQTPFADERYAAVGAGRYLVVGSQTASEFEPNFYTYGGNKKDQDYVAFAFYGAQ